jgi:formylglycine-generating enzyme required for sulfatase activity
MRPKRPINLTRRKNIMAVGTVVNGARVTSITPRMATLEKVTVITRDVNISIPEMVRISGGTFQMGSMAKDRATMQVTLSNFAIGKYPVTNGEYRGYLEAMGNPDHLPSLVADNKLAMHPVVNVSWDDAISYCEFLMQITGRKFGLPTEAQWEFAAKGMEGRKYPWGNESYEGRVNHKSQGTTAVDAHPKGQTPEGIFDMAGNVSEWCFDWYKNYSSIFYGKNKMTDPTGPKAPDVPTIDIRFDNDHDYYKIVRGGSYQAMFSPETLTSTHRDWDVPLWMESYIGFRLVEDLK